jgi:tetratricopeptide (TPR) repeat protein
MHSTGHTTFHTHLRVSELALKSGDYHAALRNLNSALNELEESGIKLDNFDMARLQRISGKVYVASGKYHEAEQAFRSAIEHARTLGDVDSEEVLRDTRHLAECLRLTGKLDESETLYKYCISELQESGDLLILAKSWMGLCQCYIDMHMFEQADGAVKTALEMFESQFGRNSFWVGRCLMTYGRLLYAQGKLTESADTIREALSVIEPQIGPYHPLRRKLLSRLAKVLTLNGCEVTAKDLLARSAEIEEHLRQFDR